MSRFRRPYGRSGAGSGNRLPIPAAAATVTGDVASVALIASYMAIGAADLAASYVNLANPGTYDIAATNSPSFAAETGWTIAATGDEVTLSTGILPTTTLTALVRFSDATQGYVLWAGNDPAWFGFSPKTATNVLHWLWGSKASVSDSYAAGTAGLAQGFPYKDGVALVSTGPAGGPFATVIRLGGGGAERFAGKIQAAAFWDRVLTTAEMAAAHTAMMAL